jgi:hypothetical protein
VAKYFEIWSFYVYRVHPHVPSLTTPLPSPHNCVQNIHVKIFHRFTFLYLCTVQRVLKTHWDSRKLDWTRFGRCEHPLTLESDWTGLDSIRLCWCVRTLSGFHIPQIVGHGKHTSTSLYYVSHYLVAVSAVDTCRAPHVSYLQ